MNIKVITRHAPQNYGSVLQSIATLVVVEALGHDCSIIDYQRPEVHGFGATLTQAKQKFGSNWLKILAYIAVRFPMEYRSKRRFDKMRKLFLKMTERCANTEQLAKLKADIFMTGSDQVWGATMSGAYDGSYFLDFASNDVKKIAFASSFGKTDFDDNLIGDYKRMLGRYQHIAVRESSAVDLLNGWNIPCEGQVLDPTLMLTREQWNKYIEKDTIKGDYVLVYEIHNNPELDKYAVAFAEKYNLPLYRVSAHMHHMSRSGKFVYCPDLGAFLSLIKNATYLVTDSFHGTSFALIFNTQFIEVLPKNNTTTRNQSLLQLTGLMDRIVKDENDFSFGDSKINFKPVDEILEKERIKSLSILKNMIEN